MTEYNAVGDVINYSITLANTGNVTVYNPVMNDPGADSAPLYLSGDLNGNDELEVGELWTFSASHTITQQDIDNGDYVNVATGSGLADTNGDGSGDTPVSEDDTETVDANQNPAVETVKTL